MIRMRLLAGMCAVALTIAGCILIASDDDGGGSGQQTAQQSASGGLNTRSYSGGSGVLAAGGYAGVTPGGSQDIGAARALIEAGNVPTVSMITYEGLFSEHDYATPVGDCADLLCVTPGIALFRPIGGDSDRVLIQLGMTSNVDAESFRHEPAKIVIVFDRSGSMGGGFGGKQKIEATKSALRQALDRFTGSDEIGIISFNHEHTIDLDLGPATSSHRAAVDAAIAAWQAGGSTDIESPLRHAFEILAAEPAGHLARRVLLFTDALPNTGNHADDDFLTLAKRYADEDIGLTAFGVGLDFGVDLAKKISEVRGANYVYLPTDAATERIMSQDLEFLLTPIAYDFSVVVRPQTGFTVSRVYGLPGGDESEFSMSAATLFLSREKGTIAVELAGPRATINAAGTFADVELTYTPIERRTSETMIVSARARDLTSGADGIEASDDGALKLAALVDMASGMRSALASFHAGERGTASATLETLETHIRRVANAIGDEALAKEADLVAKLAANIAATAPPEIARGQ